MASQLYSNLFTKGWSHYQKNEKKSVLQVFKILRLSGFIPENNRFKVGLSLTNGDKIGIVASCC